MLLSLFLLLPSSSLTLTGVGVTFFRGVDEIKALCLKHITAGPPRSDLRPPVPSLSPPFQFGVHTLTRDNGQPQVFFSSGQRRYAQRTLALNALSQIVSEFGQLPKTSSYPVRIILLASDAEIHTLANAYAGTHARSVLTFFLFAVAGFFFFLFKTLVVSSFLPHSRLPFVHSSSSLRLTPRPVLRLDKDLDHLDFQFFPVPTSNPSSISLYLARRDPWYQRYLYNLSRCVAMITPHLLPSLDIPSDAHDWLGSGLSTNDLQTVNRVMLNFITDPQPSRSPYTQMTDFAHRHPTSLPPSPDLIFRSQIENYLREGAVTHRFLLWNCEINFSDGQQNVVIVFHKSFHAGISAATKAFKAKYDLGDETPDEELQQSKAFKFIPPTFKVLYLHWLCFVSVCCRSCSN